MYQLSETMRYLIIVTEHFIVEDTEDQSLSGRSEENDSQFLLHSNLLTN